MSAEVSLALFDRSILGLQPDTTPQIKPFFYDQRRTLGVKTGSSYSFRYAGKTRTVEAAIVDLSAEGLIQRDEGGAWRIAE